MKREILVTETQPAGSPAGPFEELEAKIRSHQARAGMVGLGYVGLPLALEFARCGFQVTGIDVDTAKVESPSPFV